MTVSGQHRSALVLGALAGLLVAGAGCATTGSSGSGSMTEVTYNARSKLARELINRSDWGRAFAILEDLHRQKPGDPEVLTMRGIVYRERGLNRDAEADLKNAIELDDDSAEAHAALGILYDVQRRPDAEAQHRQAVKLSPNNPAYLNNLGFSLFLRQRFKQAIVEYEKAARLAPLSKRVRTNLGFAFAATGDLRRAAEEFRMGGSEAESKNNLGFAYERRGDLKNAYDLYLEAVRLDPAAEKPRSNLVHAAAVLGRPVPPEAMPPISAAAVPAADSDPSEAKPTPEKEPTP